MTATPTQTHPGGPPESQRRAMIRLGCRRHSRWCSGSSVSAAADAYLDGSHPSGGSTLNAVVPGDQREHQLVGLRRHRPRPPQRCRVELDAAVGQLRPDADRVLELRVGRDGDTTGTVEQTGSEADCSSGSPVYYGWYEMYPKFPVTNSSPVSPGDTMRASVNYLGGAGSS
jgi:peptidase A4-like protein